MSIPANEATLSSVPNEVISLTPEDDGRGDANQWTLAVIAGNIVIISALLFAPYIGQK